MRRKYIYTGRLDLIRLKIGLASPSQVQLLDRVPTVQRGRVTIMPLSSMVQVFFILINLSRKDKHLLFHFLFH